MISCYENVDSKGDKMRCNEAPIGGSFCKERLNRLALADPKMMPPASMPPEKLTSILDDIATLFQFLLSCPQWQSSNFLTSGGSPGLLSSCIEEPT